MASGSYSEEVPLASKSSKMSMEEKRELVYEISKWPHGASEVLQSWSRQEILQILCAELGKERKYTGLTKVKIIENLLKIVAEKKGGIHESAAELEPSSSPTLGQKSTKRQRKTEIPSHLTVPVNNLSINSGGSDLGNIVYCRNSACKATLSREDTFCKRCSCCICYKYDDNKDPSLWLICSCEPPFLGDSCGLSCHLECALTNGSSGIMKDGRRSNLDGSFYCVSCGKVNDLLGCWRKQLMIAKDTRRVDILCYRLSLSQKLLQGTEKYLKLVEIVDEAVKKLEPEVGPLTGLPVKMGRGIVNRLSCGQEVQKLCAFAVESLDLFIDNNIFYPSLSSSSQGSMSPDIVGFEDVSATSLTVTLATHDKLAGNIIGFNLWHRKLLDVDYSVQPTCTLFLPNSKFTIRGLSPATEYLFKVVCFNETMELGACEISFSTVNAEDDVLNCSTIDRSESPATNCSSLSNPSSVEDETNNCNPYVGQNDNGNAYRVALANLSNGTANCNQKSNGGFAGDADSLSGKEHSRVLVSPVPNSAVLQLEQKHASEDHNTIEDMSTDGGLNSPVRTGIECMTFLRSSSEAGLPITPCRLEVVKDGVGRSGRSKSCSKDQENGSRKRERPPDGCTSRKRSGDGLHKVSEANNLTDFDFENNVKVIRQLECDGHADKNFRQKFLTWYSLRATPQEVKVVKVFIDTFKEDPAALAEQLMDTFSECISSKRASVVPAGFCMKLWH